MNPRECPGDVGIGDVVLDVSLIGIAQLLIDDRLVSDWLSYSSSASRSSRFLEPQNDVSSSIRCGDGERRNCEDEAFDVNEPSLVER